MPRLTPITSKSDVPAEHHAVVERFLPQMMPREDVEAIVRETMAGLDLSGPRAQGAAMAALSPKLRGKADKGQGDGAKVALQHNIGLGGAAVVSVYKPAEA